jgi:hypothetical protein
MLLDSSFEIMRDIISLLYGGPPRLIEAAAQACFQMVWKLIDEGYLNSSFPKLNLCIFGFRKWR